MSFALKNASHYSLLGLLALAAAQACSVADDPDMSEGGGTSATTAGSAAGGSASSGGSTVSTGGMLGTAGSGGTVSSAGSGGGGGSAAGMGGASAGSGGASGGGGSSNVGGGGRGGSGGAGGSSGGGGFDPCPATGDCKIVPLGDSITFGTPSNNGGYRVELFIKAKTDNKHLTFVSGAAGGAAPNGPAMVKVSGMDVAFPRANEGYPGIKIGDLDTQRVANGKAFTNMPHIVLLHIGTNDMYGGNPGAAPAALGKMIDDIATAVPNALIAVSSIIPLSSGNAAIMTYNATIPGTVAMKAGQGKHVIFVDQFKDFPASELVDGVHPNDSMGYPRMGSVWYAAIKQYLH